MGYRPCRITDRKPTLSSDPEHVAKAEFNFRGKWNAGTEFPVAIRHGRADHSCGLVQWFAPAAQISGAGLSRADRNGTAIRNLEMTFNEGPNGGDDEMWVAAVHIAAA